VHGLGFSNFLRTLLGGESSLVGPLLAFNVGLELGQLGIVACVTAAGWGITRLVGVPAGRWVQGVSGVALLVALPLMVQRTMAALGPRG
jgi:hypothetical protein